MKVPMEMLMDLLTQKYKYKVFLLINIKAEIQKIWDGLDFHKDGKVNYSEFLAATLSTLVN